jgi:lambda family phage tail tape measure protein
MATLAELQINVDSTQAKTGAETLTLLADASAKVTRAFRDQKAAADALNSGGGSPGGGGGGGGTKPVNDLSSAIDNQTKKLKALEEQRKALNSSDLKTTNPAEYDRLNQVIDTNINLVNRQGNALDRLAGQALREQRAKEAAATAEQRRLEAQARAIQSNEALAARASARAERELSATLNGLSAQIKAQQEYNRTIEQLNRARSGTGANGPVVPSISSAEYDSYVKLAAAKRDEALATRDQSREIDQVRSKIDSVTATLGRAERAEIQYTRALAVLNDGLRLGALTADQYNTKLTQISTRRDQAIVAANSNTAAEARFARELFNVTSAYDPLQRAQASYNEGIRVLSAGLQSGQLNIQQFNKALGDQRQALDAVRAAQPNSEQSQAARYQAAIDRLLPYNSQLRNLAEAEKALQAAQAQGRVIGEQQIAQHKAATEAIAAERKEIERRADASRKSGNSAKQDAQALRQVPAQITDIVVSLQGGQAPLTVLLQQGGQLKDVFGGVVPALKGLATGLVSLLNPTVIIGSALLGLGVAAQQGAKELIAFNQSTILTNGFAGVSASKFSQLRDSLDDVRGTARIAAEALTLINASGKISGDVFEQVATAAIAFQRATGTALKDIIGDFASLGKDPVKAAVALDEKYKFLTSSVLAQAGALVLAGKEFEATTLLQGELATATENAAQRMVDQLNVVGKTLKGLKDGVSEVIDEFFKLGRVDTTADRLKELYRQRENAELPNKTRALIGIGPDEGTSKRVADIDKEIQALRTRIEYENYGAEQEAQTERNRQLAVSATSRLEGNRSLYLDSVARAQEALNLVERDAIRIKQGAAAANRQVTAEEQKLIDVNRSGAQRRLDEAKEQAAKKANKPAGALDTTNVQEVRSDLKIIQNEYENHYKRVTSIGEAGLVSEQATYYSQKAILEAQRKAVEDSFNSQEVAIKALQERKGNSNAQTVSLSNQLTRAETERVTTLETLDRRLDQLQSKEDGRVATRTRNIAAYKASLDAQLESLSDQGARSADGVGRGSRQAGVNQALGANDRSFNRAQRRLSEALADNGDPAEYAAKLKDLEKSHNELAAQIIQNDKDIQAANYDWTNGFTAAIEDAQDVGMNFAGSLQSALTGTFESAGDALATFVTTGTFNFRSFTTSILADLAKIAARQAASGALSGILGVAASAASTYFGGGGANGFAAGSAGATSSTLGASQAGYSSQYFQAKGGAWSGGTQMFANGGAFTNSVVSSPTSFGMANGSRGIMGEAGDEAIVPLARTRNGDLGIRALGGGGGGGSSATIVNVSVQVSESGSKSQSDEPAWNQFGTDLGAFVRTEVYSVINTESRPGGQLSKG